MLCPEISRYLESAKGLPFLYSVGDSTYLDVLNELKQNGLTEIRVSDFCTKEDRFPDMDVIVEHFRTLDVDYKHNRFVVIGFGENLALKGVNEAKNTIRRIKSVTLGNARVVILIRGISSVLREVVNEDPRIMARNLVYFESDCVSNISIVNNKVIRPKEGVGIRGIIKALEDGKVGTISTYTEIGLDDSIFQVKVIDNAYEALIKAFIELRVSERYGTSEQWMDLLSEYNQKTEKVKNYFLEYVNNENEIYEYVIGDSYKNWLYFINLKVHADKIVNRYLQYVVYNTESFGDLKKNILIDIIGIPHTDKRFKSFYEERKKLIKGFPESEMAYFVSENQVDLSEEIYRYTDNTDLEKRKIVSWVSQNGWNDMVAEIYPELGMYMKKYLFQCGSISDELTDYFDQYKLSKIQNRLTDEFMELVLKYGKQYLYTKLQTRDFAINKIEDKKSTYLYWIDALGVEYLSYIIEMANRRGLSVDIDIARADLPTITSVNRGFYDKWTGGLKYKEEELDDTKHKEKGGFFYTKDKTPVHLVKELEVVGRAIDAAVSALALHKCRQFVIVSDHGASRLAVIKEKENPHPTDTKGKHSGRCCKIYEESDREYIVEENGYFVRTDYERYAGSRAANVEVHGGATLEEIVVPIITLKLKKNQDIDIRVLNENELKADRHDGTYVELYISNIENKENVSLVIEGTRYKAIGKDATHYAVWLTEIRRQKTCTAEIFDGNDLIGTKELIIKGKTASVNSEFDDLF